MKKVPSPHDRYFKVAMSDNRVAKEFFSHHLPEKILSVVDLNSLRLENSSFVDESLRLTMADMLYSVNLDGELGYLYLLVEQQKNPDPLMPFRFLSYMLRIMDQHIKQNKDKLPLPLVVPLLFYNGKQRYPYSIDFFTLFGNKEALAREMLTLFILIDLTQIPDEEIRQRRWAGVMEFAQKHIAVRDFSKFIDGFSSLLKGLESQGANAKDYLSATLEYLLNGNIDDKAKAVKIVSEKLSQQLGAQLMSLAERLKEEGKSEAEHRIAKEMLSQKVDVVFVAKVTGLSLEEVKSLQDEINPKP